MIAMIQDETEPGSESKQKVDEMTCYVIHRLTKVARPGNDLYGAIAKSSNRLMRVIDTIVTG